MENSLTCILILRMNIISVVSSFFANQKLDLISLSSLIINKICDLVLFYSSPALNQLLKLTIQSLHSVLNIYRVLNIH
jgi:hypothetical protein